MTTTLLFGRRWTGDTCVTAVKVYVWIGAEFEYNLLVSGISLFAKKTAATKRIYNTRDSRVVTHRSTSLAI